EKKNFSEEFFFEMEVGFNDDISLFQLNDHPKPEKMFNENYPFFTGSSEYMKKHFKNYSDFVKKFLKSNSKIIEIGSNDGTFLKNFIDKSENIIGFEPSKNVAEIANKNSIPTKNNFFNKETVKDLKTYLGNTDLICASNVICHVPDLNNLIEAVDMLLSPNGTFVFEEPYLGSMFEKVSYDQIYDEHIYMFSASSIKKVFNMFNLKLVDIIPQTTHGGSMRYIIQRKTQESSPKLEQILNYETDKKLNSIESCIEFKKNCEISKNKIINKLKLLKEKGKSICGYAATSKSTTVLNYCKIGSDYIDYICDTTKEKIGKFSPGMHIPIKDMTHFHNNLTDCIYLFAWNHKDEIFNKEKNFKGEWFSHVAL
ncbi:MAG: class I SAM-dependent methyltransferase, partial [Pseudomonadota bacterium]|nr:class I SAM-dependent methyltransferase [Pseudomonadota bacterium]